MSTIPPTIPRGLYRITSKEGDCAAVHYGGHYGTLTKYDYWCKDYEPRFDTLPTKAEYEAARAKGPAAGQQGPKASSSGIDRSAALTQLENARKRVTEAQDLVESQKSTVAQLRSWGDEDQFLAGASLDTFEERLKLRDSLEEFLKNSN
jgi:hypothetical protein